MNIMMHKSTQNVDDLDILLQFLRSALRSGQILFTCALHFSALTLFQVRGNSLIAYRFFCFIFDLSSCFPLSQLLNLILKALQIYSQIILKEKCHSYFHTSATIEKHNLRFQEFIIGG